MEIKGIIFLLTIVSGIVYGVLIWYITKAIFDFLKKRKGYTNLTVSKKVERLADIMGVSCVFYWLETVFLGFTDNLPFVDHVQNFLYVLIVTLALCIPFAMFLYLSTYYEYKDGRDLLKEPENS